jgi:sec-independent protein translocase protein TatB
MFDIGWSELLVVAAVALVVVGPRELPGMLRTIGRMMAGVRRMASDFQSQFNEAMREAELDDLRKEVDGLRRAATGLLDSDPISTVRDSLKNAVEAKPDEKKADDKKAGELADDYEAPLPGPLEEPSILPPPAAEPPKNAAPGAAATHPAGGPTADGVEALRAFPPIEPTPVPEAVPPAELTPPAPPSETARP